MSRGSEEFELLILVILGHDDEPSIHYRFKIPGAPDVLEYTDSPIAGLEKILTSLQSAMMTSKNRPLTISVVYKNGENVDPTQRWLMTRDFQYASNYVKSVHRDIIRPIDRTPWLRDTTTGDENTLRSLSEFGAKIEVEEEEEEDGGHKVDSGVE